MAAPVAPSSRIFICYRRGDAPDAAGRIYDQLVSRFGQERVFIDVDNIPVGDDFVDTIAHELQSCAAFVAVIGPRWLTLADPSGQRRLGDPADYVRVELGTALKRANIRVIPVLVQDAVMPGADDLPDDLKGLARRNALQISHAAFRSDVTRLIQSIERISTHPSGIPSSDTLTPTRISDDRQSASGIRPPHPATITPRRWIAGVAVMAAAVIALIWIGVRTNPTDPPGVAPATEVAPPAAPAQSEPATSVKPPASVPQPPVPQPKASLPAKPAAPPKTDTPATADAAPTERAGERAGTPTLSREKVQTPGARALVYVYRTDKYLRPSVFVNDHEVARVSGTTGFALRLPPGPTKFVVDNRNRTPLELTLEGGRTYYLRSTCCAGGEQLTEIGATQGKADLETMKPLEQRWVVDPERVISLASTRLDSDDGRGPLRWTRNTLLAAINRTLQYDMVLLAAFVEQANSARRFEQEIATSAEMAALDGCFVFHVGDPAVNDATREASELFKLKQYPTIMLFRPDGGRLEEAKRFEGFMPASQLVQEIRQAMRGREVKKYADRLPARCR
ncbi:MAG TPA: TIR domain-containing protein [Vicinamibacterales bacterium]|nr:TIR domain-containing protein [Vicinamibacterales bacterium]